mgnify:FL=1
MYHYGANYSGTGGRGGGAVLQGPLSMACIPHDLSTLLVSGTAGECVSVFIVL